MSLYQTPLQPYDPIVQSQTPKPPFRFLRDSFVGTGQNSYTKPPGQPANMWQSLLNTMPIVSGVLQQRWGYVNWVTLPNTANRLFAFQSDSTNARNIITTSATAVNAYTEAGVPYVTPVFTPTSTLGYPLRCLTSRNYQYFFDGSNVLAGHRSGDSLKWDGNAVSGTDALPVTNIGISIVDVTANNVGGGTTGNVLGPNTSVTAVDAMDRSNPWGNVTGMEGSGGSASGSISVTIVNNRIQSSKYITDTADLTGFFNSTNGTGVAGLQVAITRQTVYGSGASGQLTYYAQIIKNGVAYGSVYSFTDTVATSGTATLGGVSNLWGGTYSPQDLVASDFGIAIWCGGTVAGPNNQTSTITSFISKVTMTAYVTGSVGTSSTSGNGVGINGAVGDGPITLTLGRIYYQVPFNSKTGHFGDLSPVSANTGPCTNSEFNLILATYNDPQVDTKYLLASADGGDPSILYQCYVIQGAQISSWSLTSNVATFTVDSTSRLKNGGLVSIGGLNHGDYMNSVFSAGGTLGTYTITGLTPTTFTIAFTHANDSATEIGVAGNGTLAIPNGTTAGNSGAFVVDYTPNTTLVNNQELLFTDQFGNEFGCTLNTPPPPITLGIKHQGRLWGAGVPGATHSVFFSKSVTELTLPNGFIAGKYEESWPGSNYFDVSDGAESVKGFLSDGTNLYIGTESHIRVLVGNSPANFQQPQIVHPQTGLINQDVWSLVYTQGSPSGSIWMTPDFRVMQSDFNTYVDIGTPIQDILNALPAATQTLAHGSYVADGEYELYILAVPVNSTSYCDTHLVFDLRARTWSVWKPDEGLGASLAILYNITAAGLPQWLFIGPQGSNVYQYTSSATSDAGATITSTATTTWMNLGEPTRRSMLNELEIFGNPEMTVTIWGANNTQDFSNPHLICYQQNLIKGPFGGWKLFLTGFSTHYKYYQFQFNSPGGVTEFLDSYNIEVHPLDDF